MLFTRSRYAFQQALCGEESMSERQRLRQLAGGILEQQTFMGAFWQRDERWRALLPFVTEGIDQLDRAIHVLGPPGGIPHAYRV
jgi:hypothetical protein